MERIISDRIRVKIFCPFITKHFNTLKTDNFATSVITRKGSLQEFAENINKIWGANSTKFEILWIPHNNNAAADAISKLIDYDDWQTTVEFFQEICKNLGKFTIGRFENNENKNAEKFNSECTGAQVYLM